MAPAHQMTLLDPPRSASAVAGSPDHGEVFTRRWVVELILDLVGYSSEVDLGRRTIVEPSCGTGAFLVPIVDRLVESCRRGGRDVRSTAESIRAFDLLESNADAARVAVELHLVELGIDGGVASSLARSWVVAGDFLLADHVAGTADYVVGNPPYVRLENVDAEVMAAYRRRCATMRGRSDLYVGFIEVGLSLLDTGGKLGFICADRWMRNQYGADLRSLITGSFAVDAVVTMHDVDAFEDQVSAYPAVVVLRRGDQGPTVVADASEQFGATAAADLVSWTERAPDDPLSSKGVEASRLPRWFRGRQLWPTGSPAQLACIADLEDRFPPLEDPSTGTRVGIGVATGCDELYITHDPDLVEPDRLTPLLQAGDIVSGSVDWSGAYLIDPWDADGLVDLEEFPKLATFLASNSARLRRRHIARGRPHQWYRTIDRVHPVLRTQPKLVLPDIKASSHPVYDDGRFYPHHNLYFVLSEAWDLEVLGGLLLSDVANLFVGAYCVRMRGGCYRFQAQYLRQVRVPPVADVIVEEAKLLRDAFRRRDVGAATTVALSLYGLDELPAGHGA